MLTVRITRNISRRYVGKMESYKLLKKAVHILNALNISINNYHQCAQNIAQFNHTLCEHNVLPLCWCRKFVTQ
jgi:hypothetical protein